MSILTAGFPEYVEINGEKYTVQSDFKCWICFEQIMKIPSAAERLVKLMAKYYTVLPPNVHDAVNALCTFYAGGVLPSSKTVSSPQNLYCYEQDAHSIYSSFYTQYKIDLEKENMHWWKFLILLKGLNENSAFMQIVRVRAIDLATIKDKEQKIKVSELKKKYALCDNRTPQQKEDDFADKIAMLF